MTNPDDVSTLLTGISSLPPLPASLRRLCELAEDLNSDIMEMVAVISQDQALTTRLLRVTNSAFYGLSRQVKTVRQAVVVLGFREVRNLAIGVALTGLKLGTGPDSPLDRSLFWRHSLAVGCTARMFELHPLSSQSQADEAFIAGLTHDVGKLIFAEYMPEEYRHILKSAKADLGTLHLLETESFGMNHADLGARLAEHWKLPDSLCRIIAGHHGCTSDAGRDSGGNRLVNVVRMSDDLVRIAQVGFSGSVCVRLDAFNSVEQDGTCPGSIRAILKALPEQIRSAEALLNLENDNGKPKESGTTVKEKPVAIFLKDPDARAVVTVTLMDMGYESVPMDRDAAGTVAGIIMDEPLPTSVEMFCQTQDVPQLDFAHWKNEHFRAEDNSVPIPPLRKWLSESLSLERRLAEQAD